MGARLVKYLDKAGKKVRVLTLPGDPNLFRLADIDCELVFGDVSDASSLKGIFEGICTVFHLAAVIISHDTAVFERVNFEGTRNMVLGAKASGVSHFIHVSSVAVSDPRASDYASSKARSEELVSSCEPDMTWTIVRPTLAYEKGGGQEFMMFLEYLKKYPVVPFIGHGRGKKRPVFVADIVQGLAAIADNPKTYGKIYNFSGSETICIRDLAKLMLKHQGLAKPIVPIPISLCRIAATLMERFMKNPPLTRYAISRIEQNADFDNSTVCEDLGISPIGVTEGLQRCYPIS
ncbi:MAG: NAD-dependent epimerase/dehydratase family protein [Desulfobacterales bacterium]|nr:NAD-dependent epimerase/dehydratase family protein [Desulfobacterales bacterium]